MLAFTNNRSPFDPSTSTPKQAGMQAFINPDGTTRDPAKNPMAGDVFGGDTIMPKMGKMGGYGNMGNVMKSLGGGGWNPNTSSTPQGWMQNWQRNIQRQPRSQPQPRPYAGNPLPFGNGASPTTPINGVPYPSPVPGGGTMMPTPPWAMSSMGAELGPNGNVIGPGEHGVSPAPGVVNPVAPQDWMADYLRNLQPRMGGQPPPPAPYSGPDVWYDDPSGPPPPGMLNMGGQLPPPAPGGGLDVWYGPAAPLSMPSGGSPYPSPVPGGGTMMPVPLGAMSSMGFGTDPNGNPAPHGLPPAPGMIELGASGASPLPAPASNPMQEYVNSLSKALETQAQQRLGNQSTDLMSRFASQGSFMSGPMMNAIAQLTSQSNNDLNTTLANMQLGAAEGESGRMYNAAGQEAALQNQAMLGLANMYSQIAQSSGNAQAQFLADMYRAQLSGMGQYSQGQYGAQNEALQRLLALFDRPGSNLLNAMQPFHFPTVTSSTGGGMDWGAILNSATNFKGFPSEGFN